METSLPRDLMSNEEWAFFERFIWIVRAPNGRKPNNHRLVLDGIFWIARTGAPWRDLPEEFGKWSSVIVYDIPDLLVSSPVRTGWENRSRG
jgi:transposase